MGAAGWGQAQEQYFAVFMDGQKIGHAIHIRQVEGAKVTTVEAIDLTISRGEISMHVTQKQTSIETTGGKPLGFEMVSELGPTQQVLKGTVDPNGKVKLREGATTQVTTWPQGAVMSEGLRLLQAATGLKAGSVVETMIFSPETMTALKAKSKIGAKEKVDLLGRVVALTKVVTQMETPEGAFTATDYVDNDLVSQKTVMPIMGMNLELMACDKIFAMSKNDVVDFLDKAAIQSPVSLAGAENAKAIQYTLKPINQAKLQFPVTDNQSVQVGEDGAVILTARPVSVVKGGQMPYTGSDKAAVAALKPGRYVQSDANEIIALSKKAVGDATDAADAAKRIESFVRKYITDKNLSVGYASALEVVQSREGDCTEHAVLTAALCRAAGIPAQVVFGVLYIDEYAGRKDVFFGHAWTQGYVGGKWVQLDATRHAVGPTRIAMAVGSGDPDEFFGMISTFGNFKIVAAAIEK
jgi:predicted ribosome-associated RNA-binding protein Tma20